MAERVRDGGGTTTKQAEQAERAERDESRPVEPERRPTYKTLDEQRGRLTEAEERFVVWWISAPCSTSSGPSSAWSGSRS